MLSKSSERQWTGQVCVFSECVEEGGVISSHLKRLQMTGRPVKMETEPLQVHLQKQRQSSTHDSLTHYASVFWDCACVSEPPRPVRESSTSLSGRSQGLTPAGEPRMSGRALRRPDRPDDAKSNTGSTSVISPLP